MKKQKQHDDKNHADLNEKNIADHGTDVNVEDNIMDRENLCGCEGHDSSSCNKKNDFKESASSDESAKIKKELSEMTELLQRSHAEFDNFRKRTEKEKSDFVCNASKDIIIKILPLLDNFELAFKNKSCTEEFIKGMELIYVQLYQMLEDEGLEKIETEGKKCNPYLHEPLLVAKDDSKESGIILEELQKGYSLNGTIIRHAKVKINKK